MDKLTPTDIKMSELLTHSRTLFVYNAGQRLSSIRYFFAIYGVILVAYFNFLAESIDGEGVKYYEHLILAFIAFTGIFICLVFYGLDKRNAELVHIHENAMNIAEKQYVSSLSNEEILNENLEQLNYLPQAPCCEKEVHPFLITKNMHHSSRIPFTYAYIMPKTFFVLSVISFIAFYSHISKSGILN